MKSLTLLSMKSTYCRPFPRSGIMHAGTISYRSEFRADIRRTATLAMPIDETDYGRQNTGGLRHFKSYIGMGSLENFAMRNGTTAIPRF